MSTPITFNCNITFDRHCRGARKTTRINPAEESHPAIKGRVPRVTRLMALAIRFEELIQSGEIADYAELARLAHVTRARITQIMNLRLLAPDIQEAVLALPAVEGGRDPIQMRQMQSIALIPDWRKQRREWERKIVPRTKLAQQLPLAAKKI